MERFHRCLGSQVGVAVEGEGKVAYGEPQVVNLSGQASHQRIEAPAEGTLVVAEVDDSHECILWSESWMPCRRKGMAARSRGLTCDRSSEQGHQACCRGVPHSLRTL